MGGRYYSEELLKDRVAVVTGGSRGIGKGIVLELAKAGANVILVDVNEVASSLHQYGSKWIGGYDEALKVVDEIKTLGRRSLALECDVAKADQVAYAVKKAIENFGRIDILVNNAGAITSGPIAKVTEEEWDYVMEVNAKGAFLCCREVIPHMIRQRYGRIINISSISGLRGFAEQSNYCSSKFALVGLTEALALELAPHNITVNAICPGIISSQMWKLLSEVWKKPGETNEEFFQRHAKKYVPLGRPQTPQDIGRTAVFLASMDNITAAAIPVSGGAEIQPPSIS